MLTLLHNAFITIRVLDVIDILLVALLFYQIYMLIRGTIAINIFMGIFVVYIVWLIVKALNMELLSSILGQIIGVGVLAIIIVFQQEIRRFLLLIGSRYLTHYRFSLEGILFPKSKRTAEPINVEPLVRAARNLSEGRTGALIVLAQKSNLQLYIETGDPIKAITSSRLIESIFFKNNPLHDGAVILTNNTIEAARCVLPLTEKLNLPPSFGLRHRAALGISENTDAIVILISEETGKIALVHGGEIQHNLSPAELRKRLEELTSAE